MEKKQTAVEWLAERCGVQALEDVIAEAKQMEKEQIIEVAMYHKDSCVQRACVESYIAKHYGGNNE
jgi:hypothetical protein